MEDTAQRVPTDRLDGVAVACEESPLGCPMITYLAVVLGFAASFALLGALT